MHLNNIGNETKLSSTLNDLTIYSSYFAELKSSKVKYRVRKKQRIKNFFLKFYYLLDFTPSKSRFNNT